MNFTKKNLIRWYEMFKGKSIDHTFQSEGEIYSLDFIEGYYSDLTHKVLMADYFKTDKLPKLEIKNNEKIDFSISIFQYGLGAYDLFLKTKNKSYENEFFKAVEWAIKNQNFDGSWHTFGYKTPHHPFSSMAQGEGVSLLVRAFTLSKDIKYKKAAEKALNFMLLDVTLGGTTLYNDDEIIFLEYTDKDPVLNGWIFSLFGLYDYLKINYSEEHSEILNKSIKTLEKKLINYDMKYWSKYDSGKMIASPFYHDLHIELLKVIYKVTNKSIFNDYVIKWSFYKSKKINIFKAICFKGIQKIFEKQ